MQLHLDNMKCGGCARTVTQVIHMVDAGATVTADPPARSVVVETTASEAAIVAALSEAGYPPRGH